MKFLLAVLIASVQSLQPGSPNQAIVADVPHAVYRDLGQVSAGMPVDIALTLNYRNGADLDRLIVAQSDPRSRVYRHWLTSAQFNAEFAPLPAQYEFAVESLRRAGFSITQTFANRTTIDARGTAALAERYFHTQLHLVSQPGHGTRYANVTPATVPPELGGLVFAVNGLNDLAIVRTTLHLAKPHGASPLASRTYAAAKPGIFGPVSAGTGLAGYGPLGFTKGYNAPVVHDPGNDGRGRSAGIVIDADVADDDLAGYLKYFGVERTGPATKRVIVDGGPSGKFFDPDALEATLDAEALVGISPGVALTIYEVPQFSVSPNPVKNITDAYAKAVDDNAVDTLNSSFGLCETSDTSGARAWSHLAQQGAALGITFHASSGDTGSSGCTQGGGVEAPASSPYVLAVGGTTLIDNAIGAYQGEAAWAGSGGGISLVFPFPSYQRGVPNAQSYGRNLPDLAFDADPQTGAALYYGRTWNTIYNPIGGTSLASPICGALLAQIEQMGGGKRLGLAATTFYAIAAAHANASAFHDVVVGVNGIYHALTGYDQVTGFGSLNGWQTAKMAAPPNASTAATPEVAAAVPQLSFQDLGRAPGITPVSIAVTLAYRNAGDLDRVIAAQNDPNSPLYRHWLTSAQFDEAYAPTQQQYAAVVGSLRSAGFRITQTYPNRSLVDAIGTAAIAERYFHTRIDRVMQPQAKGERYANVTTAYVPTSLHGLVDAVTGLHSLSFLKTHYKLVRPGISSNEALARRAAAQAGIFGPISTATNIPAYAPLAFERAYDEPIAHNSKYDGRGSASAIVIDADFKESDLTAYLATYGIARTGPPTRRVLVETDGPPDSGDIGGDNLEATLDAEALVGTAPATALWMYETTDFLQPRSAQAVVDAFNKIVARNQVDSVNSSFGGCEQIDASYDKAIDSAAQQGAALGITFHASTGDFGAYECGDAYGHVWLGTVVPASSPHVVAIGGTTLVVDARGRYQAEKGWDGGWGYGQSGGGVSTFFALPAWQKNVPNVTQLGRNLPDVSFAADPYTGLALYYFGSWNTRFNPIGGTSLSSPLFGGAIAQMVQAGGKRLGLAMQPAYAVWRAKGYAANGTVYFHDSIFGSNSFYDAVPGYDNVTGIGSMDFTNASAAMQR